METHTVQTYTLAELKASFPDAYQRAFDRFRDSACRWGTPWQDEVCDSLKAIFDRAGITLWDYSLPSESYRSYLRFDMGDAGDLTGKRAFAWLENNLFAGLRKPFAKPATRYAAEKRHGAKKPYTLAGCTPACPLTGYCADEDFLESLRSSVRQGATLERAFSFLADECAHLLEQEEEFARSEESFECWADGMEFMEDGEQF